MSTALQTQLKTLATKLDMINIDAVELTNILKATAFKVKDGVVTDEQMTALTIVANQYGLNPFTKEIYAFPDKQNGIVPVVGVDGWSRIINQHPQFNGVEFIYSDEIIQLDGAKPCPSWIDCIIYRKDRDNPVRTREFLDETYRPPFKGKNSNTGGTYDVNGPWQTHTKRFLRHKSLIQCARLAFGYVGIFDEDEAQRIAEKDIPAYIDITPKPSLDDALEAISTMQLDDFRHFDHTPYNDEEKAALRIAISERKKILKLATIQTEKYWQSLITGCETKYDLEKTLELMTDQQKFAHDDVISEKYDSFRE